MIISAFDMRIFHSKYIIICLLVLAAFQIIYALNSNAITKNSRLFIQISDNLYHKGSYSFDGETPTRIVQPLYTFFVLVFYQLTGQSTAVVVLAQILMNLLGYVVVLKTAALIFDSRLPRLLPAALAGHAAIWYFGMYILNECLFIFLTILAIYFLVRAIKLAGEINYIAASFFAALAFLTRPAGIGLILLIWLPLFAAYGKLNKPGLKFLFGMVTIVLVVTPWAARNYFVMGKLTPFSAEDAYHLHYASLPDPAIAKKEYLNFDPIGTRPDAVADSVGLMKSAITKIIADPLGFLGRGIVKNWIIWTNFPGTRERPVSAGKIILNLIQFAMLICTACGFFAISKGFRLALLLPALGCSIVVFFTYATTRFTIPALPTILILASQGAEQLITWIFNKGRHKHEIAESGLI